MTSISQEGNIRALVGMQKIRRRRVGDSFSQFYGSIIKMLLSSNRGHLSQFRLPTDVSGF